MQRNLGGVVMIALGVAVLIIALKGDVSSFFAGAKSIGATQPQSPDQSSANSATPSGQPAVGIAPGLPGSGVTVQ